MMYFLQDKTWQNNQTSSVLRNDSVFPIKDWPLNIYFTEGSTKARVKVKRTLWPFNGGSWRQDDNIQVKLFHPVIMIDTLYVQLLLKIN